MFVEFSAFFAKLIMEHEVTLLGIRLQTGDTDTHKNITARIF